MVKRVPEKHFEKQAQTKQDRRNKQNSKNILEF